MEDEGLRLEWTPGRNGSGTLTATLNGDVVAVDSLNLARAKAREDFAKRVCTDRPGIDAKAVDGELLRLAADLAKRGDRPAQDDLPEVDASRIVRPERIITPELSAVTIPTLTNMGDRVVGRWTVYIQWPDGRRERRALGPTLELPDGSRLYVHPEPGEPSPTARPGWSIEARKRWLAGERAPDPVELFKRICERIAYSPPRMSRHPTTTRRFYGC
jgi:hypothetical protein